MPDQLTTKPQPVPAYGAGLTGDTLQVASDPMRLLLFQFEEMATARSTLTGGENSREPKAQMTENQRIIAGTKTISEIRAESNDTDPNAKNLGGRAIPT